MASSVYLLSCIIISAASCYVMHCVGLYFQVLVVYFAEGILVVY